MLKITSKGPTSPHKNIDSRVGALSITSAYAEDDDTKINEKADRKEIFKLNSKKITVYYQLIRLA